jgi:hypothetical protein
MTACRGVHAGQGLYHQQQAAGCWLACLSSHPTPELSHPRLWRPRTLSNAWHLCGRIAELTYCSASAPSLLCKQVSRMQRQVEDLQAALLRSLHERGQPTVIVTDSGRGSR